MAYNQNFKKCSQMLVFIECKSKIYNLTSFPFMAGYTEKSLHGTKQRG